MTFSLRNGLKPVRNAIQFESIDDALRNKLWNHFNDSYIKMHDRTDYLPNCHGYYIIKGLWHDLFKLPLDRIGIHWSDATDALRAYFFKCEWNEIYDLIEFVVNIDVLDYRTKPFIAHCNFSMEQEKGGYRFVRKLIIPITDKKEISVIEAAIQDGGVYAPVSKHFEQAAAHLSDRKNPDYKNSVKESILAIEALCSIVVGKKSTLGDALKKLKLPLHPALEAAFSKIYGYTSDAKGIRHAMLDDGKVDYEEAKFMLISCIAFSNYLKGIAAKSKVA
ncbi:MAG: hypothetical protein HY923_02515 [Elusimicrobia bacterium]|nr:hypothetical protein [Elusimicrobiota bacterium]